MQKTNFSAKYSLLQTKIIYLLLMLVWIVIFFVILPKSVIYSHLSFFEKSYLGLLFLAVWGVLCVFYYRILISVRQLQQLQSQLKMLVMESPVGICVLSGPEHFIVLSNLMHAKLTQNRPILGKTVKQGFPELSAAPFHKILDEVYATGVTFVGKNVPVQVGQANGSNAQGYFDFEYRATYNERGKIDGIVINGVETTAQVLANEKIAESESHFRSLVQTLPHRICMMDEKGGTEYFSANWGKYEHIESLNDPKWRELIHPDDFDIFYHKWRHSLSSGQHYNFDARVLIADGTYRWHKVNGAPVLNKENKPVKWTVVFADVHAEKTFLQELERQVKARTQELKEANEKLTKQNTEKEMRTTTLSKMNVELNFQNTEREKRAAELLILNSELELFARLSSHDLQEPLRKIQLSMSRISEKDYNTLSDKGREHFRRVHEATTSMQTLINDLISYAQIDVASTHFEYTDLKSIVEDVKLELEDVIAERQVTFDIKELCSVHIIAFQFRQLMLNLINNAIKFSNPNTPPHIVIEANIVQKRHEGKMADFCHLRVSDNGIGFEAVYKEKIFEVFQRLHGKETYRGSGMGLSIVKKIVENHGGTITANSTPNEGAIFDIYIPAKQPNIFQDAT